MTRRAASAETAALLALLASQTLSRAAIVRHLIEHGSAVTAVRRLQRDGPDAVAAALRAEALRLEVRRLLHTLREQQAEALPVHDDRYPARLRDRLDMHAPPMLFARGRLDTLNTTGIAVVGCRNASRYGLDMAHTIAGSVARAGGCVVSGLARGIDAAAHAAALATEGDTIAVLGCGIDVHYPRCNAALQDDVAGKGLLITELLPGAPPLKHHFTSRNRIIAALSEIVVVVEAGERSGAVTTAAHAADIGVAVQCVMNAMHHPNMQGVIGLVRDGADVFTGTADLLEQAGLRSIEGVQQLPLTIVPPQYEALFALLGPEPIHADALAMQAGLTQPAISSSLLDLELLGLVRALPGRWYLRA